MQDSINSKLCASQNIISFVGKSSIFYINSLKQEYRNYTQLREALVFMV